MTGPHVPSHAAAVAETLDALSLAAEDRAAARLAETYARQLDRAGAIEAQADRVLRKTDGDAELAELVSALKAKLSAQTTLATIGPRLLDVLTALGAHPKARAALGKGGAPSGPSRLQAVREA
jgi:hypothetical protein